MQISGTTTPNTRSQPRLETGEQCGQKQFYIRMIQCPKLIIEARKQGMQIEEIPITIEQRQAGDTKKPQLSYAIGLARTIMVTWAR